MSKIKEALITDVSHQSIKRDLEFNIKLLSTKKKKK